MIKEEPFSNKYWSERNRYRQSTGFQSLLDLKCCQALKRLYGNEKYPAGKTVELPRF
ncbi:hypothetical protein QQ020_22510 [Fulvivirgaceae bacterium BMA12]|uniref:Uncharacterized protein n=1 Tax=Agaribacillus aureus TaxID=3051825 RepID=A0ABT8LAT4_9BACT|nr:hypothetical protein [Fulvivirgaceae bacterium BMA12]